MQIEAEFKAREEETKIKLAEFKAREEEAKVKQVELELKKTEVEARIVDRQPVVQEGHIDISKYVKLLPQFSEGEPEIFFLQWEKLAQQLQIPKENWPLIIQTQFKGKAQQIYTSLSEAESEYDNMKACILKAYELIPEAYRQKFRNYRKTPQSTYVEYAAQQERLFNRWCLASETDTLDRLKQLILLEQFKNTLETDLRIFIDDHVPETLTKAAVLADEFTLNHKPKSRQMESQKSKSYIPDSTKYSDPWSPKKRFENQSSPSHFSYRSDFNQYPPNQPWQRMERFKTNPPVICSYCKQVGHHISNCRKRLTPTFSNKTPTLVSNIKSDDSKSSIQDKLPKKPVLSSNVEPPSSDHDPCFKPFVSSGTISHSSSSQQYPISILRDTGAKQSLILNSVLQNLGESYTGYDILIEGVGGIVKCPLHNVFLRSDLTTGMVKVAVVDSLPIVGISLLLANDIAGSKVISPLITNNPKTSVEPSDKLQLFPACAVTRSQYKKSEEETYNLESLFSQTDPSSSSPVSLSRAELIKEQKSDHSLKNLYEIVSSPEEVENMSRGFYIENGVLMRKWRASTATADQPCSTTIESKEPPDILPNPPEIPLENSQILQNLQIKVGHLSEKQDVAEPLTDLLRKDHDFVWTPTCETAFKNLKSLLTNAPVLRAPDFQRPFLLQVDASDTGIGAALLQEHNEVLHAIAYYSKKLSPAQKNYSTIEKETLALVQALIHFEVYLGSSTTIQVYSDHNPLKFLQTMKNKNPRLTRWSLFLQPFNLTIYHIKGVFNVLADVLSRT
ncbi:uncharacterized protein LOC143018764 [Oratosquilla oratoria]|uniref:uncharacterized protein LOC143018764 n=1 Tax=Oratosquilla oratoria TaxID=337810 RepID=UPI003F76056A